MPSMCLEEIHWSVQETRQESGGQLKSHSLAQEIRMHLHYWSQGTEVDEVTLLENLICKNYPVCTIESTEYLSFSKKKRLSGIL